jgi:myo-inositol 2-dehydrogenase/D-chiro-inositol 1-dehydrogenase
MSAAAAGEAESSAKRPIDLALETRAALAESVRRAGFTCMIGFQRRFDPTFATLKSRSTPARSARRRC